MEIDYKDPKTIAIGVLSLLLIFTAGGIAYRVYSTNNELVCRTNKPVGWAIEDSQYINGRMIYKAYCPYTTKAWTYAYCSGFRSTSAYERYGCNEVIITRELSEETIETTIIVKDDSNRVAPDSLKQICSNDGICE